MKKLLCLSLVLLACVVANAKTTITVVDGDFTIAKNPEVVASIEVDFSEATVDDKPLNVYFEDKTEKNKADWDEDIEDGRNIFGKKWNKVMKKGKGMQLLNSTEAPYRMVIKVKKLSLGSTAASVIFGNWGGGANMSGDILLYDNNNNLVLDVDFFDVSGDSSYTEGGRIYNVFEQTANYVANYLKRMKQ